MVRRHLYSATALVTGCMSVAMGSQVFAQDQSDAMEIEEVVVTGTYLRGKTQGNSPSPIKVFGAENMNQIGASNVADLVQTLTISNGAQNNPDAFTQNATTGTSNFNLRGLGVASTLVLMNGRRQVVAGTVTNDGIAFVDTSSLAPQIAYQRIEILKDGAAALYGTDAVAGVVNFITDDNFEGVQVSGKYSTLTDEGSQSDKLIEGKVGWGNDTTHVMAAFSYYDRSPLTTDERRLSQPADDTSALGNPGAFFLLGQLPVIDPTGCSAQGGFEQPRADLQPILDAQGIPFTAGFCGFDFGEYFNLVPDEQRTQAYGVLTQQIGDSHEFRIEGAYSENKAIRNNSPTFPFLQLPSAVVPSYHPGNIFPEALGPILFFGRAIGNGGEASPNRFASETYRFSASLKGDFNDTWGYDVAVTHGKNTYQVATRDTITANFQNALLGLGGNGCSGTTPGENGCLFYNPFATSFSVLPNSQEVLDYVIGEQVIDGTSKSTVFDAVVSGALGSTAAGDIGVAFGIQYRDENWGRDYDSLSNQDAFAFIIGNGDFEEDRTAKAAFLETLVPITQELELSLAARYEDYGGSIGDTFDPKIALLYRPNESLALRGSYSTSFRAPSVFQVSGGATSLNQVSDPLSGSTAFAATRNIDPGSAGRNIKPEQGKAWNFGFSWQTEQGFNLDMDYWNYKFSDVIIQENFQAIVNADPSGDRVIRSSAGTILMVLVDFVNASSVKTEGFDLSTSYNIDTDAGVITPFFEATYIMNYDLRQAAGDTVIDGAGGRNFSNFGSPTPKWRLNGGMSFTNDMHDARFYVRHISGLDDDQVIGGVENGDISSMTTVDVQYTLNLGGIWDDAEGSSIQLGLINAFDKAPPYVSTNGGFESRTHDPRGRQAYIKLVATF